MADSVEYVNKCWLIMNMPCKSKGLCELLWDLHKPGSVCVCVCTDWCTQTWFSSTTSKTAKPTRWHLDIVSGNYKKNILLIMQPGWLIGRLIHLLVGCSHQTGWTALVSYILDKIAAHRLSGCDDPVDPITLTILDAGVWWTSTLDVMFDEVYITLQHSGWHRRIVDMYTWSCVQFGGLGLIKRC